MENIVRKCKEKALWSDQDKDLLEFSKNNSVSNEVIAILLNRTVSSVTSKASKMGFKKTFINELDDSFYIKVQEQFSSLNSLLVGTINENLVKIKLSLEGFEIFEPSINNHRTDLVLLQNGIPIKIQIKTASYNKEYKYFQTELATKNIKNERILYENTDVDFFVVKCNGLEVYYIIPYSVSLKTRKLSLFPHREKCFNSKTNFEIYRDAFELISSHIKF